jgi:hypothetical protein
MLSRGPVKPELQAPSKEAEAKASAPEAPEVCFLSRLSVARCLRLQISGKTVEERKVFELVSILQRNSNEKVRPGMSFLE